MEEFCATSACQQSPCLIWFADDQLLASMLDRAKGFWSMVSGGHCGSARSGMVLMGIRGGIRMGYGLG